VCEVGWDGSVCELPEDFGCSSKVVDIHGACCASGVLDSSSMCCESSPVVATDRDGKCCSEAVDVCGVCGGKATVIDVYGQCCAVRLSSCRLAPSALVHAMIATLFPPSTTFLLLVTVSATCVAFSMARYSLVNLPSPEVTEPTLV
jgi:hypothetical protein